MTLFSHLFFKTDNIGDLVSCPADYFKEFETCQRIDIRSYEWGDVVFGGGGLCHPGLHECLAKAAPYRAVVWGSGTNYHEKTKAVYPECFKHFSMVGLRDIGNPWAYVPCASCMHPAFNVEYPEPTNEYVIYEHFLYGMSLPVFPKLINRGSKDEFSDVIGFLASGSTILTNSYHGAYWGMLLNRRVVIINPFSSRYHWLPNQPPIATVETWEASALKAKTHTHFLGQCRNTNRAFATLVIATLARDAESEALRDSRSQ